MNLYFDTDLEQLIQSPGARTAIQPIGFKSQNTPRVNLYFVSSGKIQDEGESPVLKFGLFTTGSSPTTLVLDAAFARIVDSNGDVCYSSVPVFDTTAMRTAMTSGATLTAVGEIRAQLASGEIVHSLDIPFLIYRTLLDEGGTASPVGTETYPDVSLIELKSNKDQPSGYPSLSSAGLLDPDVVPPNAGVNLTDFQTALGLSVIHQTIGIFNRLIAGTGISFDSTTTPGAIIINSTVTSGGTTVALTDFETSVGASLIHDASGILNRLAAGVGITLDTGTTPGAIIINTTGVAALSDFETSTGTSLIHTVTGILQRLVAGTGITFDTTTTPGAIILNVAVDTDTGITSLTDFETSVGVSLIQNSSGILNRLFAGTGITFDTSTTPGAVIINASGGGSLTLVDAETTAGETLLGSTNGQVKRLIAGTGITFDPTTTPGGVILAASGGGGGGITPVHCQICRGSDWTYADNSPFPWDAVVLDPDAMWSSGDPTKITIATTGIYLITVQLLFTWGTTAGSTSVMLMKNSNNGEYVMSTLINGDTSHDAPVCMSGAVPLVAGEYFQVVMNNFVGAGAPATVRRSVNASGGVLAGVYASTPWSPTLSIDRIG